MTSHDLPDFLFRLFVELSSLLSSLVCSSKVPFVWVHVMRSNTPYSQSPSNALRDRFDGSPVTRVTAGEDIDEDICDDNDGDGDGEDSDAANEEPLINGDEGDDAEEATSFRRETGGESRTTLSDENGDKHMAEEGSSVQWPAGSNTAFLPVLTLLVVMLLLLLLTY